MKLFFHKPQIDRENPRPQQYLQAQIDELVGLAKAIAEIGNPDSVRELSGTLECAFEMLADHSRVSRCETCGGYGLSCDMADRFECTECDEHSREVRETEESLRGYR